MDRNRRDVPGFEFEEAHATRRGSFPRPLVEALVGEVRRSVEAAGWDAPFTVWGVRWSDVPAEGFRPGRRMGSAELMKVLTGDDPVEDLPGLHLPIEWDAAIICVEGLDRSEDGSAHSIGGPAGTPETADRSPARVLLYVSRSGDSYSLLLRYPSREDAPEELTGPCALAGVAGDVFRRYVGLPVGVGDHRVVELLGRLWVTQVAASVIEDPTVAIEEALACGDPVDAMLSWALRGALADSDIPDSEFDDLAPVAATLRKSDEGSALLAHLLDDLDLVDWSGARRAALEGAFPVEVGPEIVQWCDVGMFVKLVFAATFPQSLILDGLVLAGHAALAEALLTELRCRGWDEPLERNLLTGASLRPASDDPCPCGAAAEYGNCHGQLLFP